MEGFSGRPRSGTVYREVWQEVKERIEEREKLALRNKVK